jgi:NADPH:quinone reductase-like Zn-dependent oxidoreductase
MMVKTVRFHELGGPEVLRLEEITIRDPGPAELRIRVDAIGLNRAEAMFRGGYYTDPVRSLPATLGYEAAGEVEAVGEKVTGFRVGDPVGVVPAFSMNDYGLYAERAIVPATAVVHRPDDVDAMTGAAVWMAYVTAYGALVETAGVRAGDTVVLTAASSSVGLAAIQIANRIGAVPVATSRTSVKAEQLRKAGAAEVIATQEEGLVERVLAITGGRGADVVLDPVAGPGVLDLAGAITVGGTLVVYGALSREPTPFLGPASIRRGLSMRGYSVFQSTTDQQRLRRAEAFVNSGLRTGALQPVIDSVFPLDDIVQAHRHLESNTQFGKIIAVVTH